MRAIILILVALINFINGLLSHHHSDLLVVSRLGRIQGSYKFTNLGRKYRAFEGIPYAKPPLGHLRFEPPQPYGSWHGTLVANRTASRCLQYGQLPQNPPGKVTGSEDCLYLNIYTPVLDRTKKREQLLPVFFWIYNGAFTNGEGSNQNGTYLMNRDMVYVNINHRLGILGFLSTGDSVVPGNMGLKDQSMALQWIYDNIKAFGGDPAQITLAGVNGGGASVHYHYLSPMSRGLFKGGISISSTALDCWAQTEAAPEKAKRVGFLLDCPTDNNIQMVKCLKTRKAASIVELIKEFQPWLFNPITTFGPVVEKNSNGPFINRSPVEIISSGDAADVPWITSDVSEDGLYPSAEFIDNERLMAELDVNWRDIAPHLLDFNFTVAEDDHAKVSNAIRNHYLGDGKIDRANAQGLIHMIGDRLYATGAEQAAKLMAKYNKNPVWFYYYSYRNEYSLTDIYPVTPGRNYGVAYADDVHLFLYLSQLPLITDKPTLRVQKNLLDMIESFMRIGIPEVGVTWPRVNPSSECLDYLHIAGPANLTHTINCNYAQKEFWSSIKFRENQLL